MPCVHCGNTTRPTAYSDAAQAEVCEECYGRLPSAAAEIGRELGIAPCPRCGEPLGARYLPEQVCWPCTGLTPDTPKPTRPTRRVELVQRTWRALERHGPVFPLADGTDTLIGRCPRCALGSLTLRVVGTDPPAVRSRGCSDGCTAAQVTAAL